jgi:hypothetical protein
MMIELSDSSDSMIWIDRIGCADLLAQARCDVLTFSFNLRNWVRWKPGHLHAGVRMRAFEFILVFRGLYPKISKAKNSSTRSKFVAKNIDHRAPYEARWRDGTYPWFGRFLIGKGYGVTRARIWRAFIAV